MVFLGNESYEKTIATKQILRFCPACNNTVDFKGVEYGKKFSFLSIPLFNITKEHKIVCPVCKNEYKMGEEDMRKYIR